MPELLQSLTAIISAATLLVIGGIVWKGGRWAGRIETKLKELNRRVQNLEVAFGVNPGEDDG